jgi:3-oxoadipate enol-lactonase
MPAVNKLVDEVGVPEFVGEAPGITAREARDYLTKMTRGILAVRPLIDALEHPVSVFLPGGGSQGGQAHGKEQSAAEVEMLLNRVAARIGAPRFKVSSEVAAARKSVFELAVSGRLLGELSDLGDVLFNTDNADQIIDEAVAGSFDHEFFKGKAESFDGVSLRVYTAGDPGNKAVVLVAPCGMPAQLCERWIQLLGKDYFVITWESRLLFETTECPELPAFDVNAQVADLFAVMDHFGVSGAHLMGLCGGAVIAISAAAALPERVSSLSLWHGDFELGPGCQKTKHQKDLKAFMSAASAGRPLAAQIHKMFSQNASRNFNDDLAYLVLYPYANAELLYRYGKCNGTIMHADVTSLLAKVTQPTLVVTSLDDSTAHPDGSKRVAELLPNAQLQVISHGDHLSLFNVAPEVAEIANRFLADQGLRL